jgi:peptidoglycan/LPS O-acetylase OafA/YrhL
MSAAQGSDRLHGLDAVRGYALMLGIVYHATMAYLPGPGIWPVTDGHRSLFLSGLFFVSHIFRMSTFFLIAGFFGHMVVEKRGVGAFVKDRAKRIALPLVVGWPLVMAAILGAAVYGGVMMTGHMPSRPPPEAHPPLLGFPLTHLWFLYVLLWLYAATLGLRALVLRLDTQGKVRARADAIVATVAESPLAPVILALPAVAAFVFGGPWRLWFGVTTPDSSLIPNLHAAVQYFTAFGFGWLLHRQPGLINTWARRWPLNLSLAIGLTATCLGMLGLAPYLGLAQPGLKTVAYAFAYAVAMWSWTFAAIGLALKFLSGESPARRYIADSSYWLYLVHLPLVMALQAMVVRLNLPAEAKIVIVLGIAFPLMFASYQLMVRHSFIGAILNGRRAPKGPKAPRLTVQAETR